MNTELRGKILNRFKDSAEKEKNVVYSIVRYEQPLKLEREATNG